MTDTTTVATQERDDRHPLIVLRQRLEDRKGEIAAASADIPPEQIIRATMTTATINPDILGCSWSSVWQSVLKSCRDQLLPDGVQGAIVSFKNTASWLPMFQGLLTRARRSGLIKQLHCDVVRRGEKFRNWIDETGPHFLHEPGDDFSAPIVKVYCIAWTKDGGTYVAVLTIDEANKIKAMSRGSRDDAPWKKWPEEMYKKTAIRRLSKILPHGRDLLPPSEAEAQDFDVPTLAPAMPPAPQLPRGAPAPVEGFVGADQSSFPEADQSHAQPTATGGGGGGASESDQAPDVNSGQRSDASPTTITAADSIETAWEHGRQAKAAGMLRKAVPGEYRGQSATALAAAWLKGHDGTPLGESDAHSGKAKQ